MKWRASVITAALSLTFLIAPAFAQEQPPAEEPEAPAAPDVEQAPAEEPPELPAEAPPAEEPTEEPTAEEPPAEEPVADPPVEEPPVEEPPVEEPPVEEPSVEEPVADPPVEEPPVTDVEPDLDDDDGDAADEDDEDLPAESEGRTRHGAEETWSDSLPFRGTRITYENVFSARQLNQGADLTYNPYYAMSFTFAPRWYFTDSFSARMRLDLETELTDSDSTSDYHETRLGDLSLEVVYNPIVTIPGLNVSVGAGLRLYLPTSPTSQAATMYLGLSPDLRLARVFDVLDGLILAYSFRYRKNFNRYTTAQRETNPYDCTRSDLSCVANHQLGSPNTSHGFYNSIMLSLNFLRSWRPMSVTMLVMFANTLSYHVTDASVPLIGGQEVSVDHIDNPTNHSAAILYVFDVSLEITDFLGASIGASTMSPQLAPDSTYREPFFNRYTTLYVDLSLDIERLVAAFRR